MTIEQAILKRMKALPHYKQKELLDFAEFLARKTDAINEDLLIDELSDLDENELTHLEMEFDNYEHAFPRR